MLVAAGVICAWPSTVATIPSGWSRVATLDSRHHKGSASGIDPGVLGGAAVHTHSPATHNHSVAAHTHAGGTSAGALTTVESVGGVNFANPIAAHTHTFATSGSNSGTSSSETGTWNGSASAPPYTDVVWIQSDGTPNGLPTGAWAYWNDDPLSTGWSLPAAGLSTFLRGAGAGLGGGTTGGAASHTHADPGHTHIWNNHTHTGGTSGAAAGGTANSNGGVQYQTETRAAHTHTYSSVSGTTQGSSQTSANTGSAAYEPPWYKLAIVQNNLAVPDAPVGVICLWLGALLNIPAGWSLCNGANGTPDLRDLFVKGVADLTELGDTGGTLGHSHSSPGSHTHADVHTHTVGLDSTTDPGSFDSVAGAYWAADPHSHSGTSGATSVSATGSGTQDAPANADTQPSFVGVAYIQLLNDLAISITSPTDGGTVTVPGFTASWAFGGSEVQQSFRLRVFEDAAGLVTLYDSGTVAGPTQSHTLPSFGILDNSTTYYIQVRATDTDFIESESAITSFITAWSTAHVLTNLRAVGVTEERE